MITLTPDNFFEIMGMLHKKVLISHKIEIPISTDILRIESTEEKKDYLGSGELQTFSEVMNDPENTSYGPFEGSEAIKFLNRDL